MKIEDNPAQAKSFSDISELSQSHGSIADSQSKYQQGFRLLLLVGLSGALLLLFHSSLFVVSSGSELLFAPLKAALWAMMGATVFGYYVWPGTKGLTMLVWAYTILSFSIGLLWVVSDAYQPHEVSYLSWLLLLFPLGSLILQLPVRHYLSLVGISLVTAIFMRLVQNEWSSWSEELLLNLAFMLILAGVLCDLAVQRSGLQSRLVNLIRAQQHKHEVPAAQAVHHATAKASRNSAPIAEELFNFGATGCLRPGRFFETARLELKRVERYRSALSLIMFNINNFRCCNERLGPALADRILFVMAQRLRRMTREPDRLCHIRDDQFALLLPETDLYQALDVGERIQSDLLEAFQAIFNLDQSLTVRLGVVCHDPQQMQDIEALMAAAEAAMNNGREQVSLPYYCRDTQQSK